jgi:aldose 1-epimerase
VIEDDPLVELTGDEVRLELMPLGATLRRFEVRLADGSWRNIVLGSANLGDYLGVNRYVGQTVGRYANRIAGSRFSLDGTDYVLAANEGANQLHGGPDGFHSREWTIAGRGARWVEFSLASPDQDQGFPGAVQVTARYELVPGGAQVTYRATTDAPTVINLTTHPYFNLDGEGSGNADGHVLVVHASHYTPNRDDGIPTGEVRDVSGSPLDFRAGQGFGAAREAAVAAGLTRGGGFDHNFVVDGTGLREHCRLSGADGLTLVIESDQPAIQVYGGEHFDGTQVGTSGVPYVRRAGIALETQHYPDSPNRPDFPSTVLRPGAEYVATTRWLIGTA